MRGFGDRRRCLMTHRLLISERWRSLTEQRPGPSRPPRSLSPRLHSEEEPGAPGSPASLPQDGGSQMALLASTSHPNRPLWRFCRVRSGFWHIFWWLFSFRFAELKVRVLAAMSSGEGAEETTKDAGDIAAFFKPGKPENGWTGSDCAPASAALLTGVTLLPSLMGVCGAQLAKHREGLSREMLYCYSQMVQQIEMQRKDG